MDDMENVELPEEGNHSGTTEGTERESLGRPLPR